MKKMNIMALVMALAIILGICVPTASAFSPSDIEVDEIVASADKAGAYILFDRTLSAEAYEEEMKMAMAMFEQIALSSGETIDYVGTFCKEIDDPGCGMPCKEHAINVAKVVYELSARQSSIYIGTDAIRHDPANNNFERKLGDVEVHIYVVGICLDTADPIYESRDNQYRIAKVLELKAEIEAMMSEETKVWFYVDGESMPLKAVDPTESEPTESEPTESEPTESEPTESEPTESEPTESEPTESEPTESEPTEPNPIAPDGTRDTNAYINPGKIAKVVAVYGGWPEELVQKVLNVLALIAVICAAASMIFSTLKILRRPKTTIHYTGGSPLTTEDIVRQLRQTRNNS